jgi:hypothetical protein
VYRAGDLRWPNPPDIAGHIIESIAGGDDFLYVLGAAEVP